MNFKKITALLTAICFLTAFTGQSFAQSGNQENSKPDLSPAGIIAERFGKITETENFNSPQVIVNIQDLHAHPQTQKNIAAILQTLDEKYTVKRVYTEGASGRVDVSWLSLGIKSNIKGNIVSQMVENGTLTGAQYFAFLNKKDNLYGLEDAEIHRQNIERLGNIYANTELNNRVSADVKNEIQYLANKNLTPEMKKLSENAAAYHGNKMEAAKYYKILLNYAGKINQNPLDYNNAFNVNPDEFTEIKKVVMIDEMSKKLNAKQINVQLQKYLADLRENISVPEYQQLLSSTANLSDVDMLFKYILSRGFIEKGNTQLAAFMHVKELNSQVNPLDLFMQEQKLEEQIRRSLASSVLEKEISFMNDFYVYFEGYLTNRLTAKDEDYFKRNFDAFKHLYEKYSSVNHIAEIKNEFSFLNDYYNINNKRNEIFLRKVSEHDKLISGSAQTELSPENILGNAKEIIVIVTGGYHTAGVNEILDAKQISHITITPKISESVESSEINYRRIIMEQSLIFKNALAPSLDVAHSANLAAAAIMYIGKDSTFDSIDEVINNFTGIFEGKFEVVKDGNDRVKINLENGDSVDITRGANNEIRVYNEHVFEAAGTGISEARQIADTAYNVLSTYINFGLALIRSGAMNLSSLVAMDLKNETLYKAAKEYFTAAAFNGNDFGVEGPIPALEEYAAAQTKSDQNPEEVKAALTIDAIAYQQLSRMPNFFQKEALSRQVTFDLAQKGITAKKQTALQKVLKTLSNMMMFVLIAVMLAGCSGQMKGTPSQSPSSSVVVTQPAAPAALTNDYVRKVAQEFMQGNPLPRSFVGNTNIITDAEQKIIAEKGVIIYDMSVLMKALLLYPEENKDLITKMFDALEQNKNTNTTNNDFVYGDKDSNHSAVPVGQGYYWKMLNTQGGWLQNQSQPITGENAWLGNAFVSMSQAYKGSDLGDRANQRSVELAKAVLALQVESGAIRMAPKDMVANYSYLGIDYYQTASLENNVSAYSFLKNLHDVTDDAKLKNDIAAALLKLEDYIFSMYDKEEGYFLSGTNLSNNSINRAFATDCQTWIISVFGAETFDAKMKERFNVDNASVNLLKRTLELSGVKENDKYIGLDFTQRAQTVSFEWTLGWLTAAKEALLYSNDAELGNAVDSIDAYVKSNRDKNGTLKYINSNEITMTFSWYGFPLPSLASSSWMIFNMDSGEKALIVNPFDVFKAGEKSGGAASEQQAQPQTASPESAAPATPSVAPQSTESVVPKTQQTVEQTINTSNVHVYDEGTGWRANALNLGKIKVDDKGEIVIEVKTDNAAPNSLVRVEIRNVDDKGVAIASTNVLLPQSYKIANNGGTIIIKIPGKLLSGLDFSKETEVVISSGENFDGKTLNSKTAEITISKASIEKASLELPFFAFILNKLGITKRNFPKARAAIIAAVEAPFILVLSPELFVRMHGKTTEEIRAKRLEGATQMKIKANKLMRTGAVWGSMMVTLNSASFGLLIGVPLFGIFGFSTALAIVAPIAGTVFVASMLLLTSGVLFAGIASLIRTHFAWNLANPKTTLDNNVQVNIVHSSKSNLNALQASLGNAVVNENGTVSQSVFVLNEAMPTAEFYNYLKLNGFSSTGITANGETVWVKSSTTEGITYYANGVAFEDIAAAIQNKKLESKVKTSLKGERIFLDNTMKLDYIEVDTVSGKTGIEYSEQGTLRLYANVAQGFDAFNTIYFDRMREIRNAEGWQRARSIMIYLHKTRTIEAFENYLKILKNASNGNIIITEELVSQMLTAKKLKPILEQLRNDGINVVIEQTAQSTLMEEVVMLFDGKFRTQTGKIEKIVPGQGSTSMDVDMIRSGAAMEESISRSNKNIVIFEMAIEEYIESNRSGLGQFLENITSVKILKYFASAEITADSARETARNFDIERIMSDYPQITGADIQAMYDALKEGVPAENILMLNERVNSNSAAKMYLSKIAARVSDPAAALAVKQTYMEGLMEKLAVSVEFRKVGRIYGFKNKNTEQLAGQIALLKYSGQPAVAGTDSIRERIGNMTSRNYKSEMVAIINSNPREIPAVADLMLEMMFVYEDEVKMDEKDFKRTPDIQLYNEILKAA